MHFLSSVIELNANKSDSCCLIVIETVPACVSQRVGSGQILLTPGRIYPPRLTPTQQQEAVATHSSCDRDGGQRGPKKTLPSRQRNKTFISFQLYFWILWSRLSLQFLCYRGRKFIASRAQPCIWKSYEHNELYYGPFTHTLMLAFRGSNHERSCIPSGERLWYNELQYFSLKFFWTIFGLSGPI